MLDMTWLKTQSLRLYCENTNFYIITQPPFTQSGKTHGFDVNERQSEE